MQRYEEIRQLLAGNRLLRWVRYEGKQIRDLHSADLVDAFLLFHGEPKQATVYNIGGGRENACSMLEAIERCERIARRARAALGAEREDKVGDHRWWISDLDEFDSGHGGWRPKRDLENPARYEANADQSSLRAARA